MAVPAFVAAMYPDAVAAVTMFVMYALALGATALVCYKYRHEIL